MNDAHGDLTVRDHVAAEVRAEIARQKLSVSEAARRLGWGQSFLQRRVMGQRKFEVEELAQVARLLGVPIERFFPDLSTGIKSTMTSSPGNFAPLGLAA